MGVGLDWAASRKDWTLPVKQVCESEDGSMTAFKDFSGPRNALALPQTACSCFARSQEPSILRQLRRLCSYQQPSRG